MNKWIFIVLSIICLLLVGSYLLTIPENYDKKEIQFQYKSVTRSGVLITPENKSIHAESVPLVVFIHGDGDMNHDAYGYYKPLWNELSSIGVACLSLDKRGVGKSTGNWLHQSMEDRANETIAAIEFAKSELGFADSKIGLIGFSQAGWVIPKVATLSDYPDFLINISPAINWKRQSNFLTQQRLQQEGATEKEIASELAYNQEDFEIFDKTNTYTQYVNYQQKKCQKRGRDSCELIEEDRFYFIQQNIASDAEQEIRNIDCPTLLLFGADDLNIDIQESYDTYERLFAAKDSMQYELKSFPNTTHGLLKSAHFNQQQPGLLFLLKFSLFQEKAFSDGVLDSIRLFISNYLMTQVL